MDIFVFFILIILMMIYVGWPYRLRLHEVDNRYMNGMAKEEVLNELQETQNSFLQAIKEIEFDHEVGQLSDEDFNEMNAKYRGKTIEIMKSMDRLENEENSGLTSGDEMCPVCSATRSGGDRFCHNCGAQFQLPADEGES